MTDPQHESAVAIIGMSGRFPGADTPEELWANLAGGVAGLRPVTDEELAVSGVDPALTTDPHYVRVAAPISGVDQFDPTAFGLTPTEAEVSDPQHRLFLECAWQAVEAAGYTPTAVPGDVGVFAGCGFPTYMVNNAAHLAEEPGGELQLWVGNERDSLTSLVSYKFDFRGPSVDVQSFCSTSLVAVHLATQSLLTYECDMALAGGVHIDLEQPRGYLFQEGGIHSPDGTVRSFDAGAQGTVMGNGAGVVVLKRLAEAIEDGDQVHAIILGSAVNNDGRARVGYTAPGVDGEAAVIEAAIDVSGVPPESLGYIECHATGTMLGDSIELAALSRVMPARAAEPCVLGSLKPSIGHLDRASGVTGLIRAVQAMRHQVFPGTPNYRTPNRALATASDRFRVLEAAEPWPAGNTPRRAGVTSFGLGGTNAHVVIEEAPQRPLAPPCPGPHLLVWSARTAQALDAATEDLHRHLDTHRELVPADVAFTLQQSRTAFPLRRAIVVADIDDAVEAPKDPARWIDGTTRNSDPEVRVSAPELTPGQADMVIQALAHLPSAAPANRATAYTSLLNACAELGIRLVSTEAYAPAELTLPIEGEAGAEWLLRQIALLWQAGSPIAWGALHDGGRRRVTLPTYPFQRRRCWLQPSSASASPGSPVSELPEEEWTNVPVWQRRPLLTGDTDEEIRAAGPWLVYAAENCAEAVARRLGHAGADVHVVRPGSGFDETADGFRVRPDDREDHEHLFTRLPAAPRTVVHAFGLGVVPGPDESWEQTFDAQQRLGYYSLLALVGALSARPDSQPVSVVALSDGAVDADGPGVADPAAATLLGVAPTIAQENPGLSCRVVDADAREASRRSTLGDLASQIVAEATSDESGPVALRRGERWIRSFERLRLPDARPDRPTIPEGASVLITGGLGNVGLILARHLSTSRKCRLILTARSRLPARQDWARYLDSHAGRPDRTARHIRNILALEGEGAEILPLSADAGNPADMARVVDAARRRFGSLDAVVHGAGLSAPEYFATAHELDRAGSEGHFRSKVHGFHALQAALDPEETRYRITLSSLSAILGGIRLGPYAAANAALDAYALDARARGAGEWLTIDWDTWRTRAGGTGMGSGANAPEMAPEQGVGVLERALPAVRAVGHLVISTHSISDRLAQWVQGRGGPDQDDDRGAERHRHPRPVLASPYAEPRDETEQGLADAWAAVLGLDRVGLDDNFFELGGNSLIAMQLMGHIRKHVRAVGPVTAVLEHPTVRELAGVLHVPAGTNA